MKLIDSRCSRPWRILLYGKPGCGKTTFGASVPRPVIICAEDGAWGHDVPRFEQIDSWADVREAIDAAVTYDCETVVIDTLDACEKRSAADFIRHPYEGKTYESIIETPYQQGYRKMVDSHWEPVLVQLAKCERNVLFLAHTGQQKQPSLTEQEDYSVVYPAINKHLAARVIEWCDAVLYVEPDIDVVKGKSQARAKAMYSGETVVWCRENGSRTAKNRFGLPMRLPWTRNPWELIRRWIEQPTDDELDSWVATVLGYATPEVQEKAKAALDKAQDLQAKLRIFERIKRA